MPLDPELRYSEDECHELFMRLFPRGWSGEEVVRELAPEGWENSPLVAVFHPSSERIHEESVRIHQNMQRLFASRPNSPPADDDSGAAKRNPPTLHEVRADHKPTPVDREREVRELVGMCLWDVFADNHEVIGPDGRVVDLGSFRAAGGFLAEVANRWLGLGEGAAAERELERLKRMVGVKPADLGALLDQLAAERENPNRPYDYMDFYCGTQMVAGRADLSGVYRLIFRRLRELDCDWRYHFPRLLLIDTRGLRDALKEQESPEWTEYDPSAAFAEQQEDQQRDAELASLRAEMDEAHRDAVEAAQTGPPPTTVAAYRDVFGTLPEGWPPEVED
jgi:hypothetical protein